jgi:Flp pilus assembly protein TadD
MNDNPRIEALRRRVEKDPGSIAFAQLAEEYRRGGDHQQAIAICREGLARHPGYLSAQVTLGRAFIELGQFDEARRELEVVLSVAPDNLAAIRALAEIHQHFGDSEVAAPRLVDTPAMAETPAPIVEEPDPALPVLEQWLAAIVADRAHSR